MTILLTAWFIDRIDRQAPCHGGRGSGCQLKTRLNDSKSSNSSSSSSRLRLPLTWSSPNQDMGRWAWVPGRVEIGPFPRKRSALISIPYTCGFLFFHVSTSSIIFFLFLKSLNALSSSCNRFWGRFSLSASLYLVWRRSLGFTGNALSERVNLLLTRDVFLVIIR